MRTASDRGSADRCVGMTANILPRTFSAGDRYASPSSTPGSARPRLRTVDQVTVRPAIVSTLTTPRLGRLLLHETPGSGWRLPPGAAIAGVRADADDPPIPLIVH